MIRIIVFLVSIALASLTVLDVVRHALRALGAS